MFIREKLLPFRSLVISIVDGVSLDYRNYEGSRVRGGEWRLSLKVERTEWSRSKNAPQCGAFSVAS